MGEAGLNDALRVRLFSLSLTGTTFSWFSSLAPGSILNWNQLERKFLDHFFSGEAEVRLLDLTSVRQNRDESVLDYFQRFKALKINVSIHPFRKKIWRIWHLMACVLI